MTKREMRRIFKDFAVIKPKQLVGRYGDPDLWAESTMDPNSNDNLVKIYEIKPSKYVSADMVRQRIWLHDVLDDNDVPYLVKVEGYWATRKKFVEAQRIFVSESDVEKTRALIKEAEDPNNFVIVGSDDLVE